MWILKSFNNPLPNNYAYTQTEGIRQVFTPSPIIEILVKSVSAFRIANNLPRASLAETLEDVDCYQCAIRNNNRDYCRECDNYAKARSEHRFVKTSCETCGTPVNE